MFTDTFKNELYHRGISRLSPILNDDAFSRDDITDDNIFYEKDRFVNHIDKVAMNTVERLIGDLVIEKDPVILDLMAGWDSHIPKSLKPSEVTGLGLNENELLKNEQLTRYLMTTILMSSSIAFLSII